MSNAYMKDAKEHQLPSHWSSLDMTSHPLSFDELPLKRPGPPLNAWGLYGDDDELGRLNLLTAEAVSRGLKEAQHGITINLKFVHLEVQYPIEDLRASHPSCWIFRKSTDNSQSASGLPAHESCKSSSETWHVSSHVLALAHLALLERRVTMTDDRSIHRGHCNDDHVSFNTQSSTQWDGFRHYPYLDYPEKGQYTWVIF